MTTDGTRHDPETIALGLSKIAEIRAQLAGGRPRPAGTHGADDVQPPQSTETPLPHRVQHAKTEHREWSADRMTAEMAAAAARDDLQARVTSLEAEVLQLRSALAAVLNAAADGLQSSSQPAEVPTMTSEPRVPSSPRT